MNKHDKITLLILGIVLSLFVLAIVLNNIVLCYIFALACLVSLVIIHKFAMMKKRKNKVKK